MTKTTLGCGFVLLVLANACAVKGDDAAKAAPAAETATPAPAPQATPAPATPAATPAPAVTTAPAATPVTTSTVTPVAPVAETCDSLAAKTTTGGTFTATGFGPAFKDVYVTENVFNGTRTLSITLTSTANKCSYRVNNLEASQLFESSVVFSQPEATSFVPGTYGEAAGDTVGVNGHSGGSCLPPPQPGQTSAGLSSAEAGEGAKGTLTITNRTDALLEGSLDVTSFSGTHTTITFSAPICPSQPLQPTCCVVTLPQ